MKLTPLVWALWTSFEGERNPSLRFEWEWSSKTSFSPHLREALLIVTAKSSGGEERGGEGEEPTKSQSVTDFIASDWSEVTFFLLLPPRFAFFLLFLFFSMLGFWNRREFDRQRETRKENMLKRKLGKKKKEKEDSRIRPAGTTGPQSIFFLG